MMIVLAYNGLCSLEQKMKIQIHWSNGRQEALSKNAIYIEAIKDGLLFRKRPNLYKFKISPAQDKYGTGFCRI